VDSVFCIIIGGAYTVRYLGCCCISIIIITILLCYTHTHVLSRVMKLFMIATDALHGAIMCSLFLISAI